MPSAYLLDRIRGEYREMPGLRLTLAQAQRLWQVERIECEAALATLVTDGFLALTNDNAYIAQPSAARIGFKPVKAAWTTTALRRRA